MMVLPVTYYPKMFNEEKGNPFFLKIPGDLIYASGWV